MSKVLVLDIETAPKIAYVWGLFKQNIGINQIAKDMYVLCWSAKWLNDEYIYSDALHYHKKTYKADPTDDSAILETIWSLLDEADYVVAHNGDRFDIPTLNGRFLVNGMQAPSAYRSVDTLKIARRKFRLTSNKLDFIAQYLGVGEKHDTGGFELWKSIIEKQDQQAFDRMVAYCDNDVMVLEEVYLALRPWDERHPSTVVMGDLAELKCNVCGSSHIKKNGSWNTQTQCYQKYKCVDCGHNMRSRKADQKTAEQSENLLRSI